VDRTAFDACGRSVLHKEVLHPTLLDRSLPAREEVGAHVTPYAQIALKDPRSVAPKILDDNRSLAALSPLVDRLECLQGVCKVFQLGHRGKVL